MERNRRYAFYETVNPNSQDGGPNLLNVGHNIDRNLHWWFPFENITLPLSEKFVDMLCIPESRLDIVSQNLNIVVPKNENTGDYEFLQPEDENMLSKSLEKYCSMNGLTKMSM